MIPKLFAFDLDGTLLDSQKRVSRANIAALREMDGRGIKVAIASGRIRSTIEKYLPDLGIDAALLTLNGAQVFTDLKNGRRCIYSAELNNHYANQLINYCADKPVALNYYYDGGLFTVKTKENSVWTELYYQQTGAEYNFLDDFSKMAEISPSKILLVGDSSYLHNLEKKFTSLWNENSVYICRTWTHYLEFMSPKANKGIGLEALCAALRVNISDTAAFGDEQNDIPMLKLAGLGIAMKNSSQEVKACAKRVTEKTNDEDGIAYEWERMKSGL